MKPLQYDSERLRILRWILDTSFNPEWGILNRSYKIMARLFENMEFHPNLKYSYWVDSIEDDGDQRIVYTMLDSQNPFFYIELRSLLDDADLHQKTEIQMKRRNLNEGFITEAMTWRKIQLRNGKLTLGETLSIYEPEKILDYIVEKNIEVTESIKVKKTNLLMGLNPLDRVSLYEGKKHFDPEDIKFKVNPRIDDFPDEFSLMIMDNYNLLDYYPIYGRGKHELGSEQWHRYLRPVSEEEKKSVTWTDRRPDRETADFMTIKGQFFLFPVKRQEHKSMVVVDSFFSNGGEQATIYFMVEDESRKFTKPYQGYLACCRRMEYKGFSFYLCNYFHFCYLVGKQNEAAKSLYESL